LRGVRIEDCSSTFGGGLALSNDAKVTWSGGSITGCTAAYGGGVFASGGTLTLSEIVFSGNTAQAGGAIHAQDATPVSLVSCVLDNNVSSGDGGALSFLRCGVSLSDCRVRGNRAAGNGGGMSAGPGTYAVCGYTVFSANQAALGGGVYAFCDGPAGAGCSVVQLVHADLVRNMAGASGAAAAAGASRLEAQACVVAFNSGSLVCLDPRGVLDVGCTLLHGNGVAPGSEGCSLAFSDTTGADPLLCDVNGGVLERCAGSPALTPASCGAPFLGALGEGCPECFTTASIPTTWGGLKARYR
jgi:predicted outer membrane repeat protein